MDVDILLLSCLKIEIRVSYYHLRIYGRHLEFSHSDDILISSTELPDPKNIGVTAALSIRRVNIPETHWGMVILPPPPWPYILVYYLGTAIVKIFMTH